MLTTLSKMPKDLEKFLIRNLLDISEFENEISNYEEVMPMRSTNDPLARIEGKGLYIPKVNKNET